MFEIKECFDFIDNWYLQYCEKDLTSGLSDYALELFGSEPMYCQIEWFKCEIASDKRNVRQVLKRIRPDRIKYISDFECVKWTGTDEDSRRKLEHFCLSAFFYLRWGRNRKQFNKFKRLVKIYNKTQDPNLFYSTVYFKKNGKFDRKRTGFDL